MIGVSALCLSASLAATASQAIAAGSLSDSVAGLIRQVQAGPNEFAERAESAWRAICGAGMAGADHPEIARLRAYYFHRLMNEYTAMRREKPAPVPAVMDARLKETLAALRKRYGKTEAELRENPDNPEVQGPGRFRFLAFAALMRKDTVEALRALREGWERFRLEDDFLDLSALHEAGGGAPDALLEEGLRMLPGCPATRVAAFRAWIGRGDSASARKALDLSSQAQTEWDASPEWKVRHARALMACGRSREAETPLLRALELLDENRPGDGDSAPMRKEIFALVESARGAKALR